MAIFGIGATYGKHDVSKKFIEHNVVCIGWCISKAPALHEIFRHIKKGDIIYIKTSPIGQGIRIKAVGIVTDNTLREIEHLGIGITVRWVWNGYQNIGTINDKYNVRNNTLYEEYNGEVQNFVLDLIFKTIK